jgi:hypothetical protein
MSDVVTSIKPLIFASKLTGFNVYDLDSVKWRAVFTIGSLPRIIWTIITSFLVHYIYWNSYFNAMFEMQHTQVVRLNFLSFIERIFNLSI